MRWWSKSRAWVAGAALLAFGGCGTSQQLTDFGTTELAHTVANLVGSWFYLVLRGGA